MTGPNDVAWAPQPLPEVLTEQLRSHGFQPSDTAEIARQIGEAVGPATSASLFVDLGACNFLDGDIDGAIATWRRAVASGQVAPGARALLNLGLLYEHLHLHDRAISVLRSASERQAEPFATEAAIAEARCHCAKGDNNAGLRTLARLTENLMVNQPRSGLLGHALLQLGDVARSAGRPDRAERAWKAAASSHLSAVENSANEKLIALLVDLGRDDEARQVIDESTTSRATLTASQRLHRADLLIDLDRGEHAVELLATVRGDELTTSERFRLVDLLLSQGLINESIDHLETLTELPLVDHRMRARFALAEVYRLHGMVIEAEEMYRSVIDSDHRYWSPKAGLQLGDLHDERDDIEGAVGMWVRAASSPVQEVREDAEARLTDRVTTSLARGRNVVVDDQSAPGFDDVSVEVRSSYASDDLATASASQADMSADETADVGLVYDDGDTVDTVDTVDIDTSQADAAADTIEASTFANEVRALDASEADDAHAGDDLVAGVDGADDAHAGDDLVAGVDGADDAHAGDDLVVGADGADDAHAGDDLVVGADGADDAHAGDDLVVGADGADDAHAGDDLVVGDVDIDDVLVAADADADDTDPDDSETSDDLVVDEVDADDHDEHVVGEARESEAAPTAIVDETVDGVAETELASDVAEPAMHEVLAEADVAEPLIVHELVAQDIPVESQVEPAAFVAPIPTGPPTVIPLRSPSRVDELIPPPSVEIAPAPAVSTEPFIVALGAAALPDNPVASGDPFAELAPADAHQLVETSARGSNNPYAELSPTNLKADNHIPLLPAESPDQVSPDQLRLDAAVVDAPVARAPEPATRLDRHAVATPDQIGAADNRRTSTGVVPGQAKLPLDVPGWRPFKGDDASSDELRWKTERAPSNDDADETSAAKQGFFSKQLDD